MEAGSSRSGGMPQVRCSASASQNVPGVRYLQRPRSQGRQVCGSGQVNSFVSSREGSIASLPLLLSGSFIRFYGRCCTPRRRPIDKAASLVKYTMHMVFLFCDCPQVLLFVCLAYRKSKKRNEARTRYRHPTNGGAIRRSPAGPLDLTRFAPVEAASSSLPATFQKENTILTDGVFFLERATRLELATSTLARSRSTR